MTDNTIQPLTSVCIGHAGVKVPGTIGESSIYSGLLVQPSTGTYGNGVIRADAYYGDSNQADGEVFSVELMSVHPQTTTPYSISQAFTTADSCVLVKHCINKTYWLKGSSLSATKGDKLVCAANGLVVKEGAHTGTPKSMHTWICQKTVSSATWVKGKYKGLTMINTA